MNILQGPFNSWKVVFALYLIGSMMKGFEAANQVDLTMLSLSHDSAMIGVDVQDAGTPQTGWTMAAPTVTSGGSTVTNPAVTQTPAAATAGDSHSLAYSSGLSPATKYTVTLGTVTSGAAVTAGALEVSFCTDAAPIMGLMVDDEGTTTSAIKIKWTAPTVDVGFEAFIGSDKIGEITSGATTEFTFETSDGTAALEADTDYTCTVKSAAASCGGQSYQAEASVACKVTSASGDDDDDDEKCNAVTEKLATWMFVLSSSIFFSMKKITSA